MFWGIDNDKSVQIYDEQELAELIINTIKWYKERNNELFLENQTLHDNAEDAVRKEYDEKIQQLKVRIDLSYGEFASQKEKERYKDFEQRHLNERLISKTDGGKRPYLIPTYTGIGTVLTVVCPICGKSEDITDTEAW